jgi:hypothetical protein
MFTVRYELDTYIKVSSSRIFCYRIQNLSASFIKELVTPRGHAVALLV